MRNVSYSTSILKNLGKFTVLLSFLIMLQIEGYAQFAVTTNSSSGLSATYPSLADAITALNGATITAPVVITCPAGNETNPAGGYSITATGTLTNTIIIQGAGATSVITAPSPAGTAGNLNDAIFKIIGGDYITIQGFSMNENAANTVTAAATNTMVEWGVALLYATTTNGAQNCSIQNNSIILNRTYQNTFGIYSNSTHSATAPTTSATATTAAGGNSGLKIYSNTVSNVNQGIVIVGPTAAADYNTGIDIGGTSISQANTITNFGTTGTFSGYANVSGSVNGILVRNSIGFNISFNSLTSSVGGVTSGTLRGIFNVSASNTPTGTFTNNINNNTIALTYGVSSGAMQGITVEATNATTTSTLNINNNNFTSLTASLSSSVTITAISSVAPHLTISISGNTFTNITTNTTGSFTFFGHSYTMPASGSQTLNNNSIVTSFNKTGAGGTVTISTSGASSPNSSTHTFTNNNFSNITVTGATAITGVTNSDGSGSSANRTVTGNTFNNWTGGTSAITCMNYSYIGTTSNYNTNSFTNITGQGSITGLNINATFNGGTPLNISSNTINNLTSTGTGGTVVGINCSNTSTTVNINNNAIGTLASTGASAVTGISVSGATTNNIFKNTICDLSGSNASSTVNGILLSGSTTANISNNRIGDLRAPAANAANPVNGLNITGGTTVNCYYNTVNIATSSSGALFGSSAISASTSPTLTLINNIFNNQSSTSGAGLAVAYRRSNSTLTTYGASSDKNDFAASTIYTDGTTPQVTLSAFKTLVGPTRDAASINVLPAYTSAACGNVDFLKVNTAIASQLESGGINVSGLTDDFENTIRQGNPGYPSQVNGGGSAPDIGADEFDGIPAVVCSGTPVSSVINAVLSSVCSGSGTTLSLSTIYTDLGITYQWKSSTSMGGPYLTTLGTSATQSTGNLSGDTYFICEITCTNSGLTFTTAEKVITIINLPSVMVTPSSASYCTPGGSAIALLASGADTYVWSPAAGLSATTGASVNASPSVTTTYTVTGTASANGCTNTASTLITISSSVFISNTTATPSTICAGENSQLNVSAGTTSTYTLTSTTFGLLTPSGGSTNTATGDDALLNTVTLPFTVSFFGNSYSSILLYSNGYVAFQTGVTGSPYVQTIPDVAAPDNFIAISHDDLNVNSTGQMSYFTNGTAPNRIFVINYNGVKYYNTASNNGNLTGQIQIYETDHHIEIHVQNSVDPSLSAKSLGIENVGGTLGYSPASRNNLSYDITTPEAWKFSPSGGTLTYSWIESPSNPSTLASTNIANPMANGITVDKTYFVTVTDGSGCSATSSTSVIVSAGAAITTQPSADVKCVGQNSTFTVVATGPGLTYQWRKNGIDLPDGGTISGTTLAALTITGVVSGDAGNYDVVVRSTCGGSVTSALASLTVNSLPSVSVTPGTGTICTPGGSPISLTASGGLTYTWSPAAGLSATTGSVVDANPSNTSTYTVTGVDVNGCTNTATSVITISPNPSVITISPSSATICAGEVQLLTATGGGPNDVVGSGTGFVASTLQPTAFCNRFDEYIGQQIYTAAELIAAGYSAGNLTSLSFNVSSLGDAATNNNYEISIGHVGSTTTFPSTSFLSTAGFTNVYGPVTHTHTATGWQTITFSTPFLWNGVDNICIDMKHDGIDQTNNAQTQFTLMGGNSTLTFVSSTPGATSTTGTLSTSRLNIRFTPASSFPMTWTPTTGLFNDIAGTVPYTGTPSNTVYASPTSTQTYIATATNGSGCTSVKDVTVTLSSGASITTQPVSDTKCAGQNSTFSIVATGPSLTYQWRKNGIDLTDGGTISGAASATLTITGVVSGDAGNYDVVVRSTCGSPVTSNAVSLSVNPLPTVTATNDGPHCAGLNLNLSGSTDIGVTYAWTGPSGFTSTDQNPIISPTTSGNSGTYTFTSTSSTGCTSTPATTIVVINTTPSVISISPNSTVLCPSSPAELLTATGGTIASTGFPVNFTSTSGLEGVPYRTFWDGGKLQFIYTASELLAAGLTPNTAINSIAFDVVIVGNALPNLTIQMKHTALNNFSTTNFETGMTTVFTTASSYQPTLGLNVHTFSTPFIWNGVDNIVFSTCFGIGATSSSSQVRVVPNVTNATLQSATDLTDCNTATGITNAVRPYILLSFGNATKTTWSPITGLFTDMAATNAYSGTETSIVYAKPVTTTTYTVTSSTEAKITYDGNITESAWGAALATSAGGPAPGFGAGHEVNAAYLQGAPDSISLAIAGNIQDGNRILVFIDSKTGGYNNGSFGRTGAPQGIDDFNSGTSFDAGFDADYCLVIGTNGAMNNYFFDLYTLSTLGGPSQYLGDVNFANIGAAPANSSTTQGFEIAIAKAALGYIGGDVKLFVAYIGDSGFLSNQFLTAAGSGDGNYGGGVVSFGAAAPNPITITSSQVNNYCTSSATVLIGVEGAIVKSTSDTGLHSLRSVYNCIIEGGTITYDQPTTASTVLTTPLNITKSVTIQGLSSASRPEITVPAAGVSIDATKTLTLQNVDVKSIGTATFTGAGDVSITGTTVGKQ